MTKFLSSKLKKLVASENTVKLAVHGRVPPHGQALLSALRVWLRKMSRVEINGDSGSA